MLRALRAHPHLRRLWLASTISLVGDWLSFVAVSLLALDRGGGALSLAIVLAVHALPRALLAPVAGALADRLDRRRLLVGAALGQAALTLLMALAALRGEVALVQLLVLARGAVGAFVVPAETAALRRTVPEEELLRANTLLTSTWSVTYVAGMALGGAIALFGPAIAMALDASSFLAAALLLRGLPAMRPLGEETARAPRVMSMLAATPRDLAAALRVARSDRSLFQAVFAKAPVAVAGGAGWVVLNLAAGRLAPLGSAALRPRSGRSRGRRGCRPARACWDRGAPRRRRRRERRGRGPTGPARRCCASRTRARRGGSAGCALQRRRARRGAPGTRRAPGCAPGSRR
jgi:MFS family permease